MANPEYPVEPALPVVDQVRGEHSRSLEDAELFRALETLTELKVLIPVADLDLYHGRVADVDETETWGVDPAFDNGGDKSGNGNIHAQSTLYTGAEETASEFAEQRHTLRARKHAIDAVHDRIGLDKPRIHAADALRALPAEEEAALVAAGTVRYTPEVHRIVSDDLDARVIDLTFDISTLSPEDTERYHAALESLAIRPAEGSPLPFEAKDAAKIFPGALGTPPQVISDERVTDLAVATGLDKDVVEQMAAAYNSSRAVLRAPGYLANLFLKSQHGIESSTFMAGDISVSAPVSFEYVERFMRHAHIVGVKKETNSDTVNKLINNVAFFDLERIDTPRSLETKRAKTMRLLGGVAAGVATEGLFRPESGDESVTLRGVLSDVYAKPEQLVNAAREIPGFAEIFDADAGNWEKFTLGEHTETVLRNFDENFADTLPVALIGPMRLALIAHDLGKPAAVASREKHLEKKYNQEYAQQFFDAAGVEPKTSEFLLGLIGAGMEAAEKIEIRGAGDETLPGLREYARQAIARLESTDPETVTPDQVEGYVALCKMLLTCDGGAYTSMAVTRGPNGFYRNAPLFNGSFAEPVGLGRRALRIAQGAERRAPTELQARSSERPVSRVRFNSGSNRGARAPVL